MLLVEMQCLRLLKTGTLFIAFLAVLSSCRGDVEMVLSEEK